MTVRETMKLTSSSSIFLYISSYLQVDVMNALLKTPPQSRTQGPLAQRLWDIQLQQRTSLVDATIRYSGCTHLNWGNAIAS